MPYAPGLDGIRALAVTAVVLYHLGALAGGFLGVDVFFVLSGYLITTLLLFEREHTGRISLGAFYLRRARRLLPALYVLLAVVATLAVLVRPGDLAGLRHDLWAAVGYATNWWLIAEGSSYFGAGAHPSMLTHLWSLAVEEQFYLVWPLALLGLLRLARTGAGRRRPWLTVAVPVGAAVLSTLVGALLYDPWHDPSRVYYGTDTRAVAPLLGAALAIATRPWRWPHQVGRRGRLAIDGGGCVALLVLTVLTVALTDRGPALYRGGFLLVAALAGALVVAVAHPAGALGGLLGARPLAWVGDRSYAIYLWHWPLIALLGAGGWGRDILLVALTVLLAHLSFRYVERPVRTGALVRAWRDRPRPVPARLVAGVAVGAVALACVGARVLTATPGSAVPVGPGPATTLGAIAAPSASPSQAHWSASPSSSSLPATLAPADLHGPPPRVGVFGDSQGMTLLLNAPADTGRYAELSDQTIEGCGILTGRVVSRTGERRDLGADCGTWAARWKANATRTRPQIALVMIGAWEVFDLTTGGHTLTFGSPAWDANFTAALRTGVSTLESTGARVVLALLPCYRPVRASAGYWPERGDDPRTRHLNDLLRAAAAGDRTRVSTVDPPAEFCTDPEISVDRDYRWDGVHYYKPGAALYLRTVLPQLLALTAR